MSRYGCMTMGTCARMLLEDALHAIDGEVRVEGDGGTEWVKEDGLDAKREVSEAFRELAHHMNEALASARVFDRLAVNKGLEYTVGEYMTASMEELNRFEDDWAWVYDDDEDGQPE